MQQVFGDLSDLNMEMTAANSPISCRSSKRKRESMVACTIPEHAEVIRPPSKEKSSESELAVRASRNKSARMSKREMTADTSSLSNYSHAPIHWKDDASSVILDS